MQLPVTPPPTWASSFGVTTDLVTGSAERLGGGLERVINSQRPAAPPLDGLGEVCAGLAGLILSTLALIAAMRHV